MVYGNPFNNNNTHAILTKLWFLGGDLSKPITTFHSHNYMIINIKNKNMMGSNMIHTHKVFRSWLHFLENSRWWSLSYPGHQTWIICPNVTRLMTTMTYFYLRGSILANVSLPSAPTTFEITSHRLMGSSILNVHDVVPMASIAQVINIELFARH